MSRQRCLRKPRCRCGASIVAEGIRGDDPLGSDRVYLVRCSGSCTWQLESASPRARDGWEAAVDAGHAVPRPGDPGNLEAPPPGVEISERDLVL